MAETPKALSVSFRQDAGSIEHNNRIFIADNVDSSRSPDNIVYVQKDLRELYHELFDDALAEYNSAQTRKDRVIENYYEHVNRGKREKLFQEVVVAFGNSETCGVGSENWQTAIELLDEYMKEFEKRNPNLKVFNAVIHLDEACPHLHIDFVPVCYNQSQGLKTRVSMKRAIQQMLGVTASKKKESEAVLWCNSERDVMTKVLNAHQINRQIVGAYHEHLPLKEYRQHAQNIKAMNQKIKTLTEQNPDDLTREEVGAIINQNKLLRENLNHQQQELNKYKTQALSDFVPIEIYNDEKRQYIISMLQKQRTPFVEEEHALYVQECYETSVKKAAAEYRSNGNMTIRDKLKFTLDRLVYTAFSFENMLELLEQMGYAVKRQKYTAIKPPYSQRFMRLKSLGADYSEFELEQRIKHRNEVPNEFEQAESRANAIQKPFYNAIITITTLVRRFEITPIKWNERQPYDFMNDRQIWKLVCCLNVLSELNINSRERLYKAADELQERIDNCSGDERDDLKIQYARISSVIRTYEEIVEGNYIDNLIRAEKEHNDALNRAEERKTEQSHMQTVNRKPKKFGRY